MNINFQKIISFFTVAICGMIISYAQTEDTTIDTERVVIVKAYTPTISDAFKQKTAPVIEDSIAQQKKPVQYSIFSVPVASTFTPAKGKAAAVDARKRMKLYDNYATLGFGNYASLLAEMYTTIELNKTDNVGAYFHHNSSQGGIDNVALDDAYYNTLLDVNYTSRNRDLTYGVELGVEYQLYNWYGLPTPSTLTLAQFDAIDPQQNYYGAKLGGKVQFEDSYFKKASLQYRYFGDALKSTEHQVTITPTIEFEVADELLTTDIIVDYLTGSFERNSNPILQTPNNFNILNLGIRPKLVLLRDDLTLHLGAALFYSTDIENEDNDIFIYPQVRASYRLLEEKVVAYGGLEGGLVQNTYRDAVQSNPYVSPTVRLTPTHNQLDAFVGLKGKLANVMSYTIKAGYTAENDKPLFVHNFRNSVLQEGYDYGNSFSYRYDDLKTVTGYGEIHFDINTKFSLGISGTYAQYSTEREQYAWNLPQIKASFTLDYQITPQWYVGIQTFYIGERKDINTAILPTLTTPQPIINLEPYLDANVHLRYKFNDRWSAFIKGNNLLGENYEHWADVPVQGIQVLGGATYTFDF